MDSGVGGRGNLTGFGFIKDKNILNFSLVPRSNQKNNFSTLVRKNNNPTYVFDSGVYTRYRRILNNKS